MPKNDGNANTFVMDNKHINLMFQNLVHEYSGGFFLLVAFLFEVLFRICFTPRSVIEGWNPRARNSTWPSSLFKQQRTPACQRISLRGTHLVHGFG